jgi:hypothetical protein
MNETNQTKNTIISYDLSNIHNYKSSLEDSTIDILKKYNAIVIDYLQFTNKNTNYKNRQFKNYIIINGLTTISHVFSMLLFYSKHTELACYHCKNAHYLYNEFIGQITEDKNSFLQLTPRDASLFVYKKSLFSIRNDYKNNILKKPLNDCTKKKLDIVKNNIFILNHFISFFIENPTENIINIISNTKIVLNHVDLINNGKNYTVTQKSFKTLSRFVELIKTKHMTNQQFCFSIETFVKKYIKIINEHYYKSSTQDDIDAVIMDKLTNFEFNDDITSDMMENEIIEYIFT